MHRERLQHLIETLQDVAKRDQEQGHNHLSMELWKDGTTVESQKVTCDTTACAFGWEALSEYGKQQGITFNIHKPRFEGNYGYGAAMRYFEIEEDIAIWLFSPTKYVIKDNPNIVIGRVQQLLNQKEQQ